MEDKPRFGRFKVWKIQVRSNCNDKLKITHSKVVKNCVSVQGLVIFGRFKGWKFGLSGRTLVRKVQGSGSLRFGIFRFVPSLVVGGQKWAWAPKSILKCN